MAKPLIAVDFDDTLVFNSQKMVDFYNRTHDDEIRLEDTHATSKLNHIERGWNHNLEEAILWQHNYYRSEAAMTAPPNAGAPEVLKRLKKRYRLAVVTSRQEILADTTESWIKRFLPGIFEGVYYTGGGDKLPVFQRLGASVVIDDSPLFLSSGVGQGIRLIVFGNYPWNQDDKLPPGVRRARNWAEVERILQ